MREENKNTLTMDQFKESMGHYIGIGGIGCPCCNRFSHKHGIRMNKDPELHRAARSRMDVDARKKSRKVLKIGWILKPSQNIGTQN